MSPIIFLTMFFKCAFDLVISELNQLIAEVLGHQSSQDEDMGHFCDESSTVAENDLWKDIADEVMNDLQHYASETRDDVNIHEKEGKKGRGKKRKRLDASLLEDISSEEPSTKRLKEPSTERLKRPRTPCMRVQMLKGLLLKKANKLWKKCGKRYTREGRGLCCSKNCWIKWERVDLRRIFID
ncbi:hypothetical protein CHS0354_014763 [Potamilus streckersoni]|uniref:Uncharacterized protein n=1 Tax=Potamilus streckersoni TaxID=2493646 RepID=A0AAE0WAR3_9BIVA|nr:hypothetical protein CHS0354_014763 [Potamilus streckersoni]